MEAKKRWLYRNAVGSIATILGSAASATADPQRKRTIAAARRVEAKLMAEAEEEGDVLLRMRSPLLHNFKTRFFEWLEGNARLQQRTKDYYTNGWRLLEGTKVAAIRLNVITGHEADRVTFPGGPGTYNNALRTLIRSQPVFHRPFSLNSSIHQPLTLGLVRTENPLVAMLSNVQPQLQPHIEGEDLPTHALPRRASELAVGRSPFPPSFARCAVRRGFAG